VGALTGIPENAARTKVSKNTVIAGLAFLEVGFMIVAPFLSHLSKCARLDYNVTVGVF
jgi:hypothetical protein